MPAETDPDTTGAPPAHFSEVENAEKGWFDERTPQPRGPEEVVPNPKIGMCFSGGGIRSATFNLGVLQGLSKLRWNNARSLLDFVGYLSTVSGGGYIASWFLANRRRMAAESKASDSSREFLHPKSKQIRHLREYSRYLAPETGLMSADTWTLVAIWFRNTAIMLAMVVLALAAIFMVRHFFPFLFGIVGHWGAPQPEPGAHALCVHPYLYQPMPSLIISLLITSMVALFLWRELARLNSRKPSRTQCLGQRGVQCYIVIPLLLAGWLCMAAAWEGQEYLLVKPEKSILQNPRVLWVICGAWLGGFAVIISSCDSSISRNCVFIWVRRIVTTFLALAPLVFVSLFSNSGRLFPGLLGREYSHPWRGADVITAIVAYGFFASILLALMVRRAFFKIFVAAFLTILIPVACSALGSMVLGWLADCGSWINYHFRPRSLSSFTPGSIGFSMSLKWFLTQVAADNSPGQMVASIVAAPMAILSYSYMIIGIMGAMGTMMTEAAREWLSRLAAWLSIYAFACITLGLLTYFAPILFDWLLEHNFGWSTAAAGWLASAIASLMGGGSSKTNGTGGNRKLEWLTKIAAPVFVLGLIVSFAWCIRQLIHAIQVSDKNLIDPLLTTLNPFKGDCSSFLQIPFYFKALAVGVIAIIAGCLIDINEFCMSHFYANRLARCYLAARGLFMGAARHAGKWDKHPVID